MEEWKDVTQEDLQKEAQSGESIPSPDRDKAPMDVGERALSEPQRQVQVEASKKEKQEKKRRIWPLKMILLLLSLGLAFGVRYVFHACNPKADGSWMVCHWSEQGIFFLGLVLSVQSLLLFFAGRGRAVTGMAISMLPVALLTAYVPGNMIPLCMMHDMRCWILMRPVTIGFCGLIVIFCLLLAILSFFGYAKKKTK